MEMRPRAQQPKKEEIPYLDDADVELIEESETPAHEKDMSVRVRAEDWDEKARAPKREASDQGETKEAMGELIEKVREEMKSWSPEKVAAYLKEVGEKVKKEWDALISAQTLIVPEEEAASQIEVGDEVKPASTPGGQSQYRIPEQKWVEIRKSRLLKLYKKVLLVQERVGRMVGSVLMLLAPGINERFLEELKKEQESAYEQKKQKAIQALVDWCLNQANPEEGALFRDRVQEEYLKRDASRLESFLRQHPEGGEIARALMGEGEETYDEVVDKWNHYANEHGPEAEGFYHNLRVMLPQGVLTGKVFDNGRITLKW